MGETTDSGINLTDVSETDNDIKTEMHSGKATIEVVITDYTAVTTSLSSVENESSKNHLQVPAKTISIDSMQDIHKNNDRSRTGGSILSITSFLDDTLTPNRVTKVIKFRLVATLTITIITVALLFLVPIIFYNINSPTTELYSFDGVAFDNVDFETCSVSYAYTQSLLKNKCDLIF